jgi:hypothetical protein
LPAVVLSTGERFGSDPSLPSSLRTIALRLHNAAHFGLGGHHIQAGLTASFSSYRHGLAFGSGGVFWHGDPSAFAAGRGVFLGTTGVAPAGSFAVPRLGALLHDRWALSGGLELHTALRYDVEWLPRDDFPVNQPWLVRTGLVSRQMPSVVDTWSTRVGAIWRISGADWVFRMGAGLYRDQSDPAVLGEAFVESGLTVVHRAVGSVPGWPDLPAAGGTAAVGSRLTLLPPGYQPPRTTRVTLGLTRRLWSAGAVSLGVTYRYTDFLVRRRDLNRPLGLAGRDQYGRPLYGALIKEGALLAATPGSRRFSGFDLVSALDVDGNSEYRGVSLELQLPLGRFARLRGNYTFADTRDNQLTGWGGGPYAQLSPFPDSLENLLDWDAGRSDGDVPHAAVLGAEIWPFGRPIFALHVRFGYRSGRPFTPGFAPGVDANGDGSGTNDPAFIDAGLAGMDALFAASGCLVRQIGQFAERNSCRDPAIKTLDVRVATGPARFAGLSLELRVDVLNLLDDGGVVRDHALYRLDPAATLTTDPGTGNVTVPLIVNANFGRPLAYRRPGRLVRAGLRVGY